MKLYWKIYLVLAVTTFVTLSLLLWITGIVLPARFERLREDNLTSFENSVMEIYQPAETEIQALADSFDVAVRFFRDNERPPLPSSGPPPDISREWRGVRVITPTEANFSVLASATTKSPRLTLQLLLTFALFVSQAIALAFGLKPVFSRVANLTRATGSFGKGNLAARYQPDKSSDEIGKLGNAFNVMAERIISLLGAHSELLNAVAHELRTPLARLSFALELAKNNPESVNEKLGLMEKDIFELDTLVSELLTYNKIAEVEVLAKEEVSLLNLCENAADGERLANSKIFVTVTSPSGSSVVRADYRLLLRAVSNLIRNAIVHAKSSVQVKIDKNQNGYLVTVSDDGEGFPPGFTQKAANPFVKGHNSTGVGLGLSIVNRIVERHSGELILSNTDTGGASASITIPL